MVAVQTLHHVNSHYLRGMQSTKSQLFKVENVNTKPENLVQPGNAFILLVFIGVLCV